MKLFSRFRCGSAHIARERLKILLAHERFAQSRSDLISILHEEILAVISRHVSFEPDRVQVKLNRGKSVSTLAVDVEIPNGHTGPSVVPQHRRSTPDYERDGGLSKMNERVV
jgi:cell division topological specificity factor